MAETPKPNERTRVDPSSSDMPMAMSGAKDWFVHEVLPLEPMLMRFLAQNWRNKSDLDDIRQDVYAQVLEASEKAIPERAKPFVFVTARNLLIKRFHHERIVAIDSVADLDSINVVADVPGPDRIAIARDSLRRLHTALDNLPPRCREAIVLRRIERLSRREIAARMGISEKTVAAHITAGAAALADIFFGNVDVKK